MIPLHEARQFVLDRVRQLDARSVALPDAAGLVLAADVVAAEQGCDVGRFMEGAQSAYRMILESFWKGDEDALRDLVSPDVARAFGDAIAARNEAGQVLDNRLVSIERATITGASLSGKDARITIRFDALIAAVTRDADGNVIAGSTSDAVETHDIWAFARTLRSSDPNWKLSDTDEA